MGWKFPAISVFSCANLQVLANTGIFRRFWVFLPEKNDPGQA